MIVAEILTVVLFSAVAVGIHALVQRRKDYARFAHHNDVAGFLLAVVGVVYAVVLGFVVVIVWERYTATQDYVQGEAAAVSDVYRLAAGFPPSLRTPIRTKLRAYIDDVLQREWPRMHGGHVEGASNVLESVAYDIDTFAPQNAAQANIQQATIAQMQVLFDARRHRFAHAQASVPVILWVALVAGALVLLGFTYLLGTENRGIQLVMTGALTAIVMILFIVIFEFDSPFRGSVSVQSADWSGLAHRLSSIP